MHPGRQRIFCAILAVLWGGLVACATYTTETADMRDAFSRGDYDAALTALDKTGIRERSQDQLLWRLEAAMILDRKGDLEKSRALLFEADRIADELFTVSISKTASSFVISDSSADYDGEDYEKIAIHAMLAHQYLELGQIDEARVEARKINNKLNAINLKLNADGKYKYKEDAHARYISALIYEARGELDSAIIDYQKALDLYDGEFAEYVAGGVPKGVFQGLVRCLRLRGRDDRLKQLYVKYGASVGGVNGSAHDAVRRDAGEVVVIHELGKIAPKFAKEDAIVLNDQIVRFSVPAVEPRSVLDRGTGVITDRTGFVAAENTLYLDAIAHDSLENRRNRMVARQMTRLLAKGQINYQAKKQFGPLGGLAANMLTMATESADTRSWTTLPQAFFVSRVRLPVGQHRVVIKTNGRETEPKLVLIKPGQIQLFRSKDV